MYQSIHVDLQNLLLSLSDALDLANPIISQHQTRVAFITWQLCQIMGVPRDLQNDIFIASLLHDVGSITPEDNFLVQLPEVEAPELHCVLGERLLMMVNTFQTAAKMVRLHHTPFSHFYTREPSGIILGAQMIHLADIIEHDVDRDVYILHQNDRITENILRLQGHEIAPQLIKILTPLTRREDFWLDLVSPRLYSILLNNGPCRCVDIGLSQLMAISEMFRAMIDFRSPFTATHSTGVAAAASMLTRMFGMTTIEVQLMKVAGNLHDLGKLAIPNRILNKPTRLTALEFAVMRQHTYHTYTILNTIGGIHQIAEWAAFHHEHLDGSGYPFHLTEKDLSINARIMAVADAFTALSEDRPYRKALPQVEVLSILKNMGERCWLDPTIVHLLDDHYDEVISITHAEQKRADQSYITGFSQEGSHLESITLPINPQKSD